MVVDESSIGLIVCRISGVGLAPSALPRNLQLASLMTTNKFDDIAQHL